MADNWHGEKRLYEKQFYAVTRKKTRIIDIPKGSDDIGFTEKNGDIHLAKDNAIMKGLSQEKKAAFRMGVFVHEMLHQVYTSFEHLEEVLNRFSDPMEREITALFANLVEDPSIEYFAPFVVGGEMLDALRFTISWIYSKSRKIDESGSPFSQLLNALIQFGDMGLIKGEFTFPEAKEMFTKLLPEFNETVLEKDPHVRIDRASKWMVLTKPLWRKEVKDHQDAEDLKGALDSISGQMQGEGEAKNIPDADPQKTEESERRDSFAEAVRKQNESDEGEKKPAQGSTAAGSKNSDDKDSDEDSGNAAGTEGSAEDSGKSEDRQKNSGNGSGVKQAEEEEEDFESDTSSEAQGSSGNDNVPQSKEEKAEGSSEGNEEAEEGHKETENGAKKNSSEKGGEKPGNDMDNDAATDENRESIDDILNKYKEGKPARPKIDRDTLITIWSRIGEERDLEQKKEDENFVDRKINIPLCDGMSDAGQIKCVNIVETPDDADLAGYTHIVESNRRQIKLLTSSLKTIIRNDYDQMLKNTSGKYNIKRDLTHTSVKIFDKRKERKNVDDLAVFLLVDNSGSMSGGKMMVARNTAAILAETFANLHIPCYIMGFTADTGKADVEQHHFVSWKNTLAERATLSRMEARACNDDGYSIRYATQMLISRRSEHKLLFVISDGAPSARRYHTTNGIADTGLAIREAMKKFPVLGLGIGNGFLNEDQMKEMYKGAFIQVKDLEELPLHLAKHLKKQLRR